MNDNCIDKTNNDSVVIAKDLRFSYMMENSNSEQVENKALRGVNLNIKEGSYVALLGSNGSGKSTLAKLINVLLKPTEGSISVFSFDSKDDKHFWDIRENCAYVFQNPDNQIVGTIVEEDVAFGPENLGITNPELRDRVEASINYVGLSDLSRRESSSLSGGQKQKLAIAGALAMKPQIIILDESTAMLDPRSREEFLSLIEKINKEDKVTVITITHDMNEAKRCEYIYVLNKGIIEMEGTPSEVFSDYSRIEKLSLELPASASLLYELSKLTGSHITTNAYTNDKTIEDSCVSILEESLPKLEECNINEEIIESDTILSIKDLSYSYPRSKSKQLNNINLSIRRGEIFAIVGASGCGKTTLVSHFNGILLPSEGTVSLIKKDKSILTTANKRDRTRLRQGVGLLFQYPEHQLFEETCYKDIAYGLRKLGVNENEERVRVLSAIRAVGLDEDVLDRSPFDLSGGQKRRVAMAGVLVMRPEVLVLDEPVAGLDPKGRRDIFKIITNLKSKGITIVIVSHNMDEASRYADRICVIKDGEVGVVGAPQEIFSDIDLVNNNGIDVPKLYDISYKVKRRIEMNLPNVKWENVGRSIEEEAKSLIRAINKARELE